MISYEMYAAFGGLVPETSFPAYLTKAMAAFNRFTYNRVDKVGEQYGQYLYDDRSRFRAFTLAELTACQNAICNLIDTMYRYDSIEAQAATSGIIRTRSSGGESVSYEAATAYMRALSSDREKQKLYRDSLTEYMDPTVFEYNPMYSGWR